MSLACAMLALGLWSQARRRPPELLVSGPGHEDQAQYARAVERLLAGAKDRVWMLMYVIWVDERTGTAEGPLGGVLEALAQAARRGVRIQVCLDQGVDRKTGELENKHQAAAAWLGQHGVRVVLDELDRTSHAKVMVVDRRWVVIGSHNWTNSAFTTNREASLLVDDPVLAAAVEKDFALIPGWNTSY
jgi:phosphatidylserine/phosphatidylglycerophosphate/cardiolipin synthase-like enzyme